MPEVVRRENWECAESVELTTEGSRKAAQNDEINDENDVDGDQLLIDYEDDGLKNIDIRIAPLKASEDKVSQKELYAAAEKVSFSSGGFRGAYDTTGLKTPQRVEESLATDDVVQDLDISTEAGVLERAMTLVEASDVWDLPAKRGRKKKHPSASLWEYN